MLIDSGNTHNFIYQSVAKKLRCPTKTIQGVVVTVANGDVLNSKEMCEMIRWET